MEKLMQWYLVMKGMRIEFKLVFYKTLDVLIVELPT